MESNQFGETSPPNEDDDEDESRETSTDLSDGDGAAIINKSPRYSTLINKINRGGC